MQWLLIWLGGAVVANLVGVQWLLIWWGGAAVVNLVGWCSGC